MYTPLTCPAPRTRRPLQVLCTHTHGPYHDIALLCNHTCKTCELNRPSTCEVVAHARISSSSSSSSNSSVRATR